MPNISRFFPNFFCSFYHAFLIFCLALLSDTKHINAALFLSGKGATVGE
jgi:hypothetical protein